MIASVNAPPVHVFFIQSNITLICALGVIEDEALADADIRFVFVRGSRQNVPWPGFDFPIPDGIGVPSQFFGFTRAHFLNARSRLHDLDAFLDIVTNERPAHYHLPYTRRDFYHLIITHPRSTGFSILEEGNCAYMNPTAYTAGLPEVSGFRRRARLVLKRIGIAALYGRRAMGRGEFQETYTMFAKGGRRYYCFSDEAFRDVPQRRILDFRAACLASEGILKAPALTSSAIVLALENVAHLDEAGVNAYKGWISERLEVHGGSGRQLAYKHHPQPTTRRDDMDQFLAKLCHRHNMSVVRLGDDVSLEVLAAKSPDLTFLLKTSTVGRYAAMLGAKVISDQPYPG